MLPTFNGGPPIAKAGGTHGAVVSPWLVRYHSHSAVMNGRIWPASHNQLCQQSMELTVRTDSSSSASIAPNPVMCMFDVIGCCASSGSTLWY
jgi:hypothetical protein